jgi:glucose-1-phosphate thymidylyltransferase
MKGIILAGGAGTRLHPLTKVVNKQLLPIYDKPMIYYPLSTLMLSGIRDILIISTPEDIAKFENLLGNGNQLGIDITYKVQNKPEGLAQAFIIGESFINNDNVALILGDNIFSGKNLSDFLQTNKRRKSGATIFGYHVTNPSRYGVVEFDSNGLVKSLEEKPNKPKSNYAVVGLYFYDNSVIDYAKSLKPSKRGELEITDLNKCYLNNNSLCVEVLGREFNWLDTGTHESMLDASNFVKITEQRTGKKIAAIEEIAWNLNYISDDQLIDLSRPFMKSGYGKYLRNLLNLK